MRYAIDEDNEDEMEGMEMEERGGLLVGSRRTIYRRSIRY